MVMEMVMHGSVLRSDRAHTSARARLMPGPVGTGPVAADPRGPESAYAASAIAGSRRGSAIRPADRPLDPPKTVSPVLSVPDRGDARLADAGRVTIAEPL